MIPAETIRSAMSANIVVVAERLGVSLKSERANARVGRCPVCNGLDHLRINVKTETWRCLRCGKGGISIDLVRHTRGLSFAEAVAFLAGDASR